MRLRLDGVGVVLDAATIVQDLTVDCPSGTVVGLLGPNGCGKSTALKTVYRALTPTSGAVLLDERPLLTALSAGQAAQHIAALAQDSSESFDFSVSQVVAMGRTPHQNAWSRESLHDREVADTALRTVGMAALAERPFAALSGGEKQRVLLARALAQEPRVLVLDEPTNHLDVSTQLDLLELICGLGVTVLTALHDLNLAAAYCDSIYLLRDGVVVAHGSPEQVLTPDRVAAVFGVHATPGVHPVTGRLHLALSRLSDPALISAPTSLEGSTA